MEHAESEHGGPALAPPPMPAEDPAVKAAAPVPRRDKSLSALSHELILRYGKDGTVIDLDEVQARVRCVHSVTRFAVRPCAHQTHALSQRDAENLSQLEEAAALRRHEHLPMPACGRAVSQVAVRVARDDARAGGSVRVPPARYGHPTSNRRRHRARPRRACRARDRTGLPLSTIRAAPPPARHRRRAAGDRPRGGDAAALRARQVQ